MTEVHPKVQVKSPVYRGSRLSAPGTRWNRGGRFIAYVPEKVIQVSRMTNVQPKILEKSPRY